MSAYVRPARAGDAPLIHIFIAELAEYEQLAHEAKASIADLDAALFGLSPRVFADIAEVDDVAVGMALWFYSFSTFTGRHGIYLEDLFVRSKARGSGAGRALLSGLARRCIDQGLTRLEWWVLDWNEPALGFYAKLGAVPQDQWTVQRLSGAALERLAEGG